LTTVGCGVYVSTFLGSHLLHSTMDISALTLQDTPVDHFGLENGGNAATSSNHFLNGNRTAPLTNSNTDQKTESAPEFVVPLPVSVNSKRSNKDKDEKKSVSAATPFVVNAPDSSTRSFLAIRRQLELEAYSAVIAAFKSQGELTWRKETVLHDLRTLLKISDVRHTQELKRLEDVNFRSLDFMNRPKKVDNLDDSVPPASDMDEEEEEGRRRKRIKSGYPYDTPLTSQFGAFPMNSENNVAYVNKITTTLNQLVPPYGAAPQVTNRPKKKKDKPKDKKKQKKPKRAEDLEWNTPLSDNLGLDVPENITEVKDMSELERIKQELERRKEAVKAELLALEQAKQANKTVSQPQATSPNNTNGNTETNAPPLYHNVTLNPPQPTNDASTNNLGLVPVPTLPIF